VIRRSRTCTVCTYSQYSQYNPEEKHLCLVGSAQYTYRYHVALDAKWINRTNFTDPCSYRYHTAPVALYRLPATGYRLPATGYRLPATGRYHIISSGSQLATLSSYSTTGSLSRESRDSSWLSTLATDNFTMQIGDLGPLSDCDYKYDTHEESLFDQDKRITS
jgi:hypothetical protein